MGERDTTYAHMFLWLRVDKKAAHCSIEISTQCYTLGFFLNLSLQAYMYDFLCHSFFIFSLYTRFLHRLQRFMRIHYSIHTDQTACFLSSSFSFLFVFHLWFVLSGALSLFFHFLSYLSPLPFTFSHLFPLSICLRIEHIRLRWFA